ncbi:MAG: TerB family tellurite resistance protein, partial [Dethiosulfatibacter sp.]|nr:TerB family tellurite resistance protein [Dethiosulfatibacter sp.]
MSKKNNEVQFNEDQLINLYGIQFAIAYADGELDKDELKKIFEVMDITGFSLEGKQKVQTYFLEPPILEEIISEMNNDIDEIKYTTYMNAIEVAIANDDISQQQEVQLKKIKESFDITNIQAEKMREFAIKAKEIEERGIDVYSCAGEPQFRCGMSHMSGTTEPPITRLDVYPIHRPPALISPWKDL